MCYRPLDLKGGCHSLKTYYKHISCNYAEHSILSTRLMSACTYMYVCTFCYSYTHMYLCACLCELLLGVSPRSSVCVPERAVCRSFSTFRLFVCVCLCELLLGVSPRLGMCAPVRAVARSFSTLRLFCMTVRMIIGVYFSLFSFFPFILG